MSNLERRIYEEAKSVMPLILEKEAETQSDIRFAEYPFICDGCIDRVVYDRTLKKFVKIKYSVGIGAPTVCPFNKNSGYFDPQKIEFREFDIDD